MVFARAWHRKTGAACLRSVARKAASASRQTKAGILRPSMRAYASLRGRREFALAMRRGVAASSDGITVFGFAPGGRHQGRSKIGIVAPATVGKATVRNRLRRRCKAILDSIALADDGRWYVIAARPEAAALSFAELRLQLLSLFERARKRSTGRSGRSQ